MNDISGLQPKGTREAAVQVNLPPFHIPYDRHWYDGFPSWYPPPPPHSPYIPYPPPGMHPAYAYGGGPPGWEAYSGRPYYYEEDRGEDGKHRDLASIGGGKRRRDAIDEHGYPNGCHEKIPDVGERWHKRVDRKHRRELKEKLNHKGNKKHREYISSPSSSSGSTAFSDSSEGATKPARKSGHRYPQASHSLKRAHRKHARLLKPIYPSSTDTSDSEQMKSEPKFFDKPLERQYVNRPDPRNGRQGRIPQPEYSSTSSSSGSEAEEQSSEEDEQPKEVKDDASTSRSNSFASQESGPSRTSSHSLSYLPNIPIVAPPPPPPIVIIPPNVNTAPNTLPTPTTTPPDAPQARKTGYWTEEETIRLIHAVNVHGQTWARVARDVQTRDANQCEKRWRRIDPKDYVGIPPPSIHQTPVTTLSSALPSASPLPVQLPPPLPPQPEPQRPSPQNPTTRTIRPWTNQEDNALLQAVQIHGQNWRLVASLVPTRNTRQCKEHFLRVLSRRSDVSSPVPYWSKEEDEILLDAYQEVGPRWTLIKDRLEGRNEGACEKRLKKLKGRESSDKDGGHTGDEELTGDDHDHGRERDHDRGVITEEESLSSNIMA
ncbi:uncharacterized protein SPPG_01641 [Spizellomyces punctatus DAOM BR117]|uniref:Uncharacterized protein n=1 Tax=Spizellomyces punctatus (strain DAOM BR117) TaxID=645134 RepID=A0A0L0HSX3_SPIPD|nr:uncharacterized protein SPPG_01641 [Spizellomyces punctatus DAOM BR117]KND04208.1 hypothetical protein SPPG_01641 [Spizellomyces punctatus DAOM BR117]|eukprot:XP_016612247.1 hypothetical protein SPPG_01641 [Spizellomyces punctatus DAOM BR117]